jgi:hypothetical protein
MTIHALRLHGRRLQLVEPTGRKDDHAPLFVRRRASSTKVGDRLATTV